MQTFEQIRKDNKLLFMELSTANRNTDEGAARFDEIKKKLTANNMDLQAISKAVGLNEPRIMRYKGGYKK